MSNVNKILRGLIVLLVMIILAFLVWKLASGVYLYPGIVVAVLITAGIIFLLYRYPKTTSGEITEKNKSPKSENQDAEISDFDNSADPEDNKVAESNTDVIPVEEDVTDIPPQMRKRIDTPFRSIRPVEMKQDGTEVAARYLKFKETGKMPNSSTPEIQSQDAAKAEEAVEEKNSNEPPVPLIEDESTLTEDDRNELVNAVWYRCENPYCKYTRFLTVHHILEEKEGGTNKLDNLIVLCPYCHDLAHRKEIPEKEMRDWISNRQERFKFKPTWRYF